MPIPLAKVGFVLASVVLILCFWSIWNPTDEPQSLRTPGVKIRSPECRCSGASWSQKDQAGSHVVRHGANVMVDFDGAMTLRIVRHKGLETGTEYEFLTE